MSLEIRRKFLLHDNSILKFLTDCGVVFNISEISQFYTKISKNTEVRYRKQNDTYTKTQKSGTGTSCNEITTLCDISEYQSELKNKIGDVLHKTRYHFKLNANDAYIDEYIGELHGLNILQIKFNDELYAVFFKLKQPLLGFVKCDVSAEPKYKNKSLATLNMPDENIDKKLAKSVLEKNDLDISLPKNINISYALKIVLNQNYKNKNYAEISNIFSNFNDVFDTHTSDVFAVNFKKLSNITSSYKNLINSTSHIKNNKKNAQILDFLALAIKAQESNISRYIDENIKFLKDFEMFLDEDSGFYDGKKANQNTLNIVAYTLRTSLVRLRLALKNIDENSKNTSFYKLTDILETINLIDENFGAFFDFKAYLKVIKKTQILLNILRNLSECEICLNACNSLKENEKLSKILILKMHKKRDKLIKTKAKMDKISKKVSNQIKIYYQG
ncbi:hypothetical protein LMG7974_00904 [Campylobacter majalis]|uniref:CHAD domain-containing protein n=1 Tax=Campylobacter majalis TaxID=2790656 RepID=A0ABN7K6T7_9BACT|nr:hypothetical protein [Campylobacter majalis]CAD7288228.1 hypothetical protein LMG7974_00904 [Campylobacter majalis]